MAFSNRRIRRQIEKESKKLEREQSKYKQIRNSNGRSKDVKRLALRRIRKLDTSSSEEETSIKIDENTNSVSSYFLFHFIWAFRHVFLI